MGQLVTPSPLLAKISFFETRNDTARPIDGEFLRVVTSEKLTREYLPLLEQIRRETDSAKRKALKGRLPCITPAGTFTYKSDAGLKAHSGLAQFDIDPEKNPWLNERNAPSFRDQIINLSCVAYAALSASGKGVWGVVRLAYPDRHGEQYEALIFDFAAKGIILDPMVKPVSSYRYWSPDKGGKIDHNALLYTGLLTKGETAHIPTWTSTRTGESLAARAARYLIDTRATVACQYDDYLRTCAACKDAFGDEGQDVAWSILENSPAFQVSNFRKDFAAHWHSLKRAGGNVATGGTLVYLAEQHGFDKRTGSAWYHTPAPTLPAPRKEPDAAIWQTVTTPPPAVTIPARDCSTPPNPPAIDTRGLTDRERRAIAAAVKTNSKTADLIARFDLQLVGVSALHN